MDIDFYGIYFPRLETPSSEEIRQTLERGFEAGWTTTRDGGIDRSMYSDISRDLVLDWRPTEEAIDELATRKRGSISIFGSNSDFVLNVAPSWERYGLPELGGVSLIWERVHFRENVAETTQEAFDIAALAYDELAPPFAFSYLPYRVERETTITRSDLEDGRLPDIFWVMFLSEPVCERFGRDRLQTSPIRKTESLPDGGIGIVVTADPYQYSEEEKNHFKDHLGI